jgi:hypothetical protein
MKMGKDQIAVTITMVVMIVAMLTVIAFGEPNPKHQTDTSEKLLEVNKSAILLWEDWTAMFGGIQNSPEKYPEFRERIKAELIQPCQEIIEILEKEEAKQAGFIKNKRGVGRGCLRQSP